MEEIKPEVTEENPKITFKELVDPVIDEKNEDSMIIEESHEFEDSQSENETDDLQDFEMIREEMDDKIEEMEERLLDE